MPNNELSLDLDELLNELDAMDVRQNRVRPLKKKKINLWITIPFVTTLVASVLLFTYGGNYIIDYLVDAKKQEELHGSLADIVNQNTAPPPQPSLRRKPQLLRMKAPLYRGKRSPQLPPNLLHPPNRRSLRNP